MERFYLYLMMTKPSDQLILSYPTVTAEGKQTRPSGIIGEMKNGSRTSLSGRRKRKNDRMFL